LISAVIRTVAASFNDF